jgi:hypothetical protein
MRNVKWVPGGSDACSPNGPGPAAIEAKNGIAESHAGKTRPAAEVFAEFGLDDSAEEVEASIAAGGDVVGTSVDGHPLVEGPNSA